MPSPAGAERDLDIAGGADDEPADGEPGSTAPRVPTRRRAALHDAVDEEEPGPNGLELR